MRKSRRLIALAAGLAAAAAVLAHPGTARAANYNAWQGPDGLCMGVQGGNMAPGTDVIAWTCEDTPNQFWALDANSGAPNYYLMRNEANPSECLSVLQMATYNGAPLVIWPCKDFSGNQDQRWSLAGAPSGHINDFIIYNFNSGLLMLPLGSLGSQVVQWDGRAQYVWTSTSS